MNTQIICGNNIELLKSFPDNHFDSVVTDPPYGLGKEPDAHEMLKAWVETGYLEVKGSGFMGKEWDAFVPQPIFWKEVFRVLKHGGHVLSFFGTRTYDWGIMAMRLAGFEVRDCIQWVYGSGFPKSHNISKAIDKLNGTYIEKVESPNSRKGIEGDEGGYDHSKKITLPNPQFDEAKQWEGWGSALKPANEPIVLARKPLEKGLSIAENVLKWGTGGINIDGCRIGTEGATQRSHQSEYPKKENGTEDRSGHWARVGHNIEQLNKGRFPANFIMTHHPDCVCVGTKKVGNGKEGGYNYKGNNYQVEEFVTNNSPEANSNYGEETIENWNCHEDCPIKMLDEQSGERKGWASQNHNNFNPYGGNSFNSSETNRIGFHKGYDDIGGASRFFYVAKASKSEKNKGLEGFEEKQTKDDGGTYNEEAGAKYGSIKSISKNFHPTVKPVKLMQYLVRLITPPNGIVLDPFNGSGTTGVACKKEGFSYVGLELDEEYCKIALARINSSEINDFDNENEENTGSSNVEEEKNDNQLSLF